MVQAMKREQLSDDVTLYLGDCLEVMKTLPDNSVDAVITDPPYGIGEQWKRNASRENLAKPKDYMNYEWDRRLSKSEIDELVRISNHQVIFGGNIYANWLPSSTSWIVWDKLNSGDFSDCELAWTSHKKAVRKFTYLWNGMIKQKPEERFHPTQKPLALMKWIVENYTTESDTILDPFMGSGTTLVAAVQTGRKAIGIEIDETYYEIAKKRIQQAMLQIRMEL